MLSELNGEPWLKRAQAFSQEEVVSQDAVSQVLYRTYVRRLRHPLLLLRPYLVSSPLASLAPPACPSPLPVSSSSSHGSTSTPSSGCPSPPTFTLASI